MKLILKFSFLSAFLFFDYISSYSGALPKPNLSNLHSKNEIKLWNNANRCSIEKSKGIDSSFSPQKINPWSNISQRLTKFNLKIFTKFKKNELKPPSKRSTKYYLSQEPVFPPPHKESLTDKAQINFLRRMAQYANFAYCFPEHNEIGKVILDQNVIADAFQKTLEGMVIIAYFRGPHYTRDEWKKRPIDLLPIEVEKYLSQRPLVDSVWHQHVQKMMPSLIQKLKKFWGNKKTESPWRIHFVGHGIGGGTVDSLEDKEHDVHFGPYLRTTMGNCEGFALDKEVY
ncbi:hypothetical protein G9A89_000044 [Geosiphon pyriformis]|nr:hypothetical protein G9A89_000044 [Geosiphon pyriformis]